MNIFHETYSICLLPWTYFRTKLFKFQIIGHTFLTVLSLKSLSTFARISIHAVQTSAAMLTRVSMAIIDHLDCTSVLRIFCCTDTESYCPNPHTLHFHCRGSAHSSIFLKGKGGNTSTTVIEKWQFHFLVNNTSNTSKIVICARKHIFF